MKRTLTYVVALSLFVCGCAMDRLVEVSTSRVEVEPPNSYGLTATNAVEVFRDVANQLGFRVKGPIQDSRTPNEFEFSARDSANSINLTLMANDERISFLCAIYGTPKDFPPAQQAAALFERALDKRGAHYKVVERKSGVFPLND